MNDDLAITAEEHRNVSEKASNIISYSSPSSYYDEIITRLQLQAQQQQQYHQKLEQRQQNISLQTSNRKKIVLLVDDEADHCFIYQIVLQDAGYECISYTDSVQALQEFRPNYYDLVILDIRMPTLDGFALCKKIREIDNKIQIIFITASEEHYNKIKKQNYPELENVVSIQKPIGNEELVRVVNIAIAARG